jgi:hypothetical protein
LRFSASAIVLIAILNATGLKIDKTILGAGCISAIDIPTPAMLRIKMNSNVIRPEV